MEIEILKNKQIEELRSICENNGVDFKSMDKLVQSERLKKLQKRNHYIHQTIDSEIEKALGNENK
ncbi:MAG: DNA modification system-associated small protein [Cyclobacteriaceae bacterium]